MSVTTLLRRACLPLLGLVLLGSCTTQRLAVRAMTSLLDSGFAALNEETDLILAEHSAASSLKLLEGLIKERPLDGALLLRAAQGYIGYSLAFAEGTDSNRASLLYSRGRDYALRALAASTHRYQPEIWLDPDATERFLAGLDRTFVPVLFWAANGWAGTINNSRDDPDVLAEIPTVLAIARFVLNNEPNYHHGGAHLVVGSIVGSFPASLGGDPAAARTHFEQAIGVSDGGFLMAYVLYAQTFAVQSQNRTLFETLLRKVLEAPPHVLPEQNLANAVARARAGQLLEQVDDFFI